MVRRRQAVTRSCAPQRELLLIRHGQSTANVAHDLADATGAESIDVAMRDADVPLSAVGEGQAADVGRWLSAHYPGREVSVWSSPYLRAHTTAALALAAAGRDDPIRIDERLRDKELGILDRLTWHGVQARFPQEWARFQWLGKFYYRPPAGESWADMAMRVRSVLSELPTFATTIVFTHDAMVFLFRYVCLNMDESSLLELAHAQSIGNCSFTRLVWRDDAWSIDLFNDQSHLSSAADTTAADTTATADTTAAVDTTAAPVGPSLR